MTKYPYDIKISIVVPVYNSEIILPELLAQISNALSGQLYEVILVNDGSADNSWDVIISLSKKYDKVIGICLARNFGQDNAIMAGLNNTRGEYIVIMDDDLQHSPYDISKLVAKCESGYDVCYAKYYGKKQQAWWKNVGSYINAKQAEFLIGKPSEIYLSPFKVIRRVIINSIINYQGSYPYVDGLIFSATRSIAQVEVEHNKRFASKSNYTLKKSISVFLRHTTGFSIVPLRIASLFGILVAFIGLILSLYYAAMYFRGNIVEGWTTLVLLQLIMGGAILMALGIIGEYIGRIYLVANKRPQFVVRKILL
ncbi:MAG: glycosyltransferase family 2 protein [Nitrospirae bacterium]|nr:glycosyltransferase family 2 protein [Nitrospirota bacterium]